MEFDETKPEPIVAPDTPNKTKFNPEEAPEGKRLDGSEDFRWHYKVLRNYNRGTHKGRRNYLYRQDSDRKHIRLADNLGIYDSIACQLDLPAGQKRWAKRLFRQLDFKKFSQPNDAGRGVALAAFCACSYVCWECDWRTHPNHTDRNPHFLEIQEALGISDSNLRTWYGRFENMVRVR